MATKHFRFERVEQDANMIKQKADQSKAAFQNMSTALKMIKDNLKEITRIDKIISETPKKVVKATSVSFVDHKKEALDLKKIEAKLLYYQKSMDMINTKLALFSKDLTTADLAIEKLLNKAADKRGVHERALPEATTSRTIVKGGAKK